MIVTLDTNALTLSVYRRIRKAARAAGVPARFRSTSVSERETQGSNVSPLSDPRVLAEGAVIGESRIGRMILWDDATAARLEDVLRLMSNGAFPKQGGRGSLTKNQRNQLRDAHHLTAHAHAGGAIFITDETNAFGRPGSRLRLALENLCSTRIMSVDEFCAYCDSVQRAGHRRRFGLP